MIIRRIEVKNFRKLADPVTIENLPEGLAIVVGDNEEGKSTLLSAIRSCFFDKHNMTGERAQSFQPYRSAVRPEVNVEFEINGNLYKIFKAFCQKPEAELVTPTGRFMGAAAEEELGRLLRFTPPQRARRDAGDHEHEGIFGMFWVEQGKSFAGVNPTAEGRATIQQALHHEVGDVLGGRRGQRILAEVIKIRTELMTSTGRPKAEYAKATDTVLEIEKELASVEVAVKNYARNLEDLERYHARQGRYDTDHVQEDAEERLRAAQEEAEHVDALRHILEHAASQLAAARAERDLASNSAEQRAKRVREGEESNQKVAYLKTSWDAKDVVLAEVREQVRRKEIELSHARDHFEHVNTAYTRAIAAEQLARAHADLETLVRREHEATQIKIKAEKALEAASAIRIEKRDMNRLRKGRDEVTTAQAQLDALATNVRIDLESGVKARIGHATVVLGAAHRLTETTLISVSDRAKITVVPGGDVGNPRARLKRAQDDLTRALEELSVTNLSDAEARLDERERLSNEVKNYHALVQAYAPEGLDVLQSEIAVLRGEIKCLTEQAGGNPKDIKEAVGTLMEAQRKRGEAEDKRKLAEKGAERIQNELLVAQADESGCKAAYESEERRQLELEESLANERKVVSDGDLQKTIIAAAQKVTTADQTVTAARGSLDSANPEIVALELNGAEGFLLQLQKDMRELRDRTIRLESDLRATGAQGLGERSQQLEADLQAAKANAAALDLRAKTVNLLFHVLTEAERAAKETFLHPVTDRVQPYLKLLLPETELRLNEEMDIVGVRRRGIDEEFGDLSLGTREQLAVLTRLAFADLLRENGQPAAVLLDDAIVFADDERFRRMLHILRKAAEKTQIIVLTCHERNYETAGVPIIRLAECRV